MVPGDHKDHKELKSARDPNVGPPDRSGSRVHRTVPDYVIDDVFGLVELYIYLGCLVMIYLVLSSIYI